MQLHYCKTIFSIANHFKTFFPIAKLSQLSQKLLHLAKIIATHHCTISRLSQDYDQPIAKPHFIAKPIANQAARFARMLVSFANSLDLLGSKLITVVNHNVKYHSFYHLFTHSAFSSLLPTLH
jgi:hypothetical protein